MNSILQKLVVGQGCDTGEGGNGGASAQNPVSQLVDQVWRQQATGPSQQVGHGGHTERTAVMMNHGEHPDMFASMDPVQQMRLLEQQQQQRTQANSSGAAAAASFPAEQTRSGLQAHGAPMQQRIASNTTNGEGYSYEQEMMHALEHAWGEAQKASADPAQMRAHAPYTPNSYHPGQHMEQQLQWPTHYANMYSMMSQLPPQAQTLHYQQPAPPEAFSHAPTGQRSSEAQNDEVDLEREYERNLEEALGSHMQTGQSNTAPSEDVHDARRSQAARLAQQLREDPDERFANSELTDFLTRISLGYLKFDDTNGDVVHGAPTDGADALHSQVQSTSHTPTEPAVTSAPPINSSQQLENMWREALEQNDSEKIRETIHAMAEAAGQDAMNGGTEVDSNNMDQEMQDQLMKAWAEIASSEIDDWGDILSPPETRRHSSAAPTQTSSTSSPAAYDWRYDAQTLAQTSGTAEEHFQRGLHHLRNHENREAIHSFEAAVNLDETHSEAWRCLGQAHADNDDDRSAITCLHNAVHYDPFNLEARLAIGVSYLNEKNYSGALENLQAWAQHNPEFAGMDQDTLHQTRSAAENTMSDDLMQLMNSALETAPGDPQALIVQGLLYTLRMEYHTASQCFKEALKSAPTDYSLWNKFGATLTRSGRSQEALPAYQRALQLNPSYVRAQLNVGISQYNLGKYDEAVTAYLKALRINPEAKHLWSQVRLCFTCQGRYDLVAKTEKEDIGALGREFGV
eukprot:gb/GECG01016651.1/.p1 GENE.gb/GECG01016651.1/~~gb/GECG01016651.1/.p1  ORF type:complete len:742 (+),score=115.45 gb/GECG01016651.1/:1-2226(+)